MPRNITASGSLAALNDVVGVGAQGFGSFNWEIDSGLTGTVVFEATLDDSNWFAIDAIQIDGTIITSVASFAARGALTSMGYSQVRLRVSAYTSGSSATRIEGTSGWSQVVRIGDMIPAGTNNIGDVDILSIVPGTGATSLGKAEDAAHTSADVGVMSLAVRRDADTTLVDTDGDYAPFQVNVNGALKVEIFDGGDSHTVDGTVTADAGSGTFTVGGVAAHDAAVSGNPVLNGLEARTTLPTAVADGDVARAMADDLGRLVNYPYAPRDRTVHNRLALTTTTETTLIAAGGAGVLRDLVWVMCSNESATETRVDIRDSTTGTVRISIDLAADGGGAVMTLPVPMTQATANNNWTAQLSGGVSTVYVHAIAVEQN